MPHTVVVVGPSGRTGSTIVEALLHTPDTRVIGAVRTESLDKPSNIEWKSKGVEIVPLDLDGPKDVMTATLKGADTVISVITYPELLTLQFPLIDAAKEAGVKRFVPCDFGTACVRGIRSLYDGKLAVHDYVEKVGLGYTYIDVGWWMELGVPFKPDGLLGADSTISQISAYLFKGDKKTLYTDRTDIGRFVARIVSDPRTLNRYVIIWGEEKTQSEAFAIAREAAGYDLGIVEKTPDELQTLIDNTKKQGGLLLAYYEYLYSMWVRGDNTLENAKKAEYGSALDARVLYPDVPVRTLKGVAEEYYRQ